MMFGSNEGMVENFATQFESDGKEGYLYRYYGRGVATPVGAAERDAFIAAYRRGSRWRLNIFGVAMLFAIFGFVVLQVALGLGSGPVTNIALVSIMLLGAAAFLLADYRGYGAPARARAGRASVGRERSREEAKAIAIARQSWGQIFSACAGLVALFGAQALRHDVLHGWERLWLVGLAAGVVGMIYVIVRKWQMQVG